jgi:hypothetical protein
VQISIAWADCKEEMRPGKGMIVRLVLPSNGLSYERDSRCEVEGEKEGYR